MAQDRSVTSAPRSLWPVLGALGALLGCLVWSYWPTLSELSAFWLRNADYSVGALVPLVALYLVYRDRQELSRAPVQPCVWGLAVLLAAELLRQVALYYGVGSGERYALVLSIAGAVLLAAGWRVARRVAWVLVFLLLMVPLPARIHEALALPLQRFAASIAVVALELLGFFVVREGQVLRLNEHASVGVAEACSGLRMLTAFVVVASLLAFLVRRPRWHKAVLLGASIPIAVFSNAVRSVLTAIVVYYSESTLVHEMFHDAAGLAMMPLGLLLSLGLLKFLGWLSADDGGGARTAPASRAVPRTSRGVTAPASHGRRPLAWPWWPRARAGRGKA